MPENQLQCRIRDRRNLFSEKEDACYQKEFKGEKSERDQLLREQQETQKQAADSKRNY